MKQNVPPPSRRSRQRGLSFPSPAGLRQPLRGSLSPAWASLLLWVSAPPPAVPAGADPGSVAFEKQVLTDKYFCDGIHFGDMNRDGRMDIVAGPYWYEGPGFTTRHEFYPAVPHEPARSPSDSLFSFVYDFNQDGWPDILVLGRVHLHQAFWYENPRGKPGPWRKHFVFERVQGESPTLTDLTGDGRPEIITHWEGRWGWLQPDWNEPTRPWSFHPITEPGNFHHFYHGTGVGDVNGDGRLDLILNEGWWEQPAAPSPGQVWTKHPYKFSDKGGAQMFAYDVDGDGLNDIITSLNSHGWGLAWFQQVRSASGGITFQKHLIMGDRSEEARYGAAFTQTHALVLEDIDGDGLKDIVTGKRMWAHGPKGDIEPDAAPVLYWFKLMREPGRTARFVPLLVDDRSGVGVQVTTADVTGNGRPDILTVSKLGTFLFRQRAGP